MKSIMGSEVDGWKLARGGKDRPKVQAEHKNILYFAGVEATTSVYFNDPRASPTSNPVGKEIGIRFYGNKAREMLAQQNRQLRISIRDERDYDIELREGVYVPRRKLKQAFPEFHSLAPVAYVWGVLYNCGFRGPNAREHTLCSAHYSDLGKPEAITLTLIKTICPLKDKTTGAQNIR